MIRLRHVGRRENSPHQSAEIELLRIGKAGLLHGWRCGLRRAKEFRQFLLLRILAANAFIVGAEFLKDSLVAIVEGVPADAAFVIDDGAPTAGTQDPQELCAREGEIEPVERLCNCNEVGGVRRQAGPFRCSGNTLQFWKAVDEAGARRAHSIIRLHRSDRISAGQKNFSQQAGSGCDIHHRGIRLEMAMVAQPIDNLDWVSRAIEAIAVYAV